MHNVLLMIVLVDELGGDNFQSKKVEKSFDV